MSLSTYDQLARKTRQQLYEMLLTYPQRFWPHAPSRAPKSQLIERVMKAQKQTPLGE